jgi:hypothetical protein
VNLNLPKSMCSDYLYDQCFLFWPSAGHLVIVGIVKPNRLSFGYISKMEIFVILNIIFVNSYFNGRNLSNNPLKGEGIFRKFQIVI